MATKRKKTKPISISLEHPENNPKGVTVRKVILNEDEPLGFIPMPVELNSKSTTVTQNEIDPELKNTNQKETVEMSNATKSNAVNAVTETQNAVNAVNETQPETIQPVVPETGNGSYENNGRLGRILNPIKAGLLSVDNTNINTTDQSSTQSAVKSLTPEEIAIIVNATMAAMHESSKQETVEMPNATKSNEVSSVNETQPKTIRPDVPETENSETADLMDVDIDIADETSTQNAAKGLAVEERDAKLDELIAALQEQAKPITVGRTLMTGLVLGAGMAAGCFLVEKAFACLDR